MPVFSASASTPLRRVRALRSYGARGGAVCLLLCCWLGAGRPAVAQQQAERCAVEQKEAEDHYLYGRFDQAVSLLQACVDRQALSAEESVRVYRLLALAYLNQGNEAEARTTVAHLLRIVPAYTADPVQDPPSYAGLVDEAKAQQPSEAPRADEPAATPEAAAEGEQEGTPEAAREEQPAPPPLLPDEPLLPDDQQARPPRLFGGPKPWLMATGGAVVLFTAVALALGGG